MDVVLRAVGVYLVLLIILRITGKRTMAQVTSASPCSSAYGSEPRSSSSNRSSAPQGSAARVLCPDLTKEFQT